MGKQDEDMLTEAEVARMLGVSLSTVKRLRASGEGPPSIRVGKRALRYRRSDVEAWLQRRGEQ